jgi:lysophospholipase L1-like esterase
VARAAWAQNHDVTLYNLGIRGDSTRDILRRWRGECAARLPQSSNGRLVFMFGGNDAKEVVGAGIEVPLQESVANARTIIAAAAAWLPTLWLSLIPMSETKPYPRLLPGLPAYRFDNRRQGEYTQHYAAVAQELAVPFLDLHTPLMHDAEWQRLTQAGDGSNPAASGYAKIAALIAAWPAWRAWFDDV